jgi:hypothetical protein
MLLNNTEGLAEFNIDSSWYQNRVPGISVYFRVKNEVEFVRAAILSVIDWATEVLVALQPSSDGTEEEIRKVDSSKVRVISYPFELWPNGEAYQSYDSASVHCKTFYYNWVLSKTSCQWALKWDGDMVALPSLGRFLDQTRDWAFLGHDIVKYKGNRMWLSKTHPVSNAAPSGFFRVSPDVQYVNGPMTHRFWKPITSSHAPGKHFLHMKWCKQSWNMLFPESWETTEHYRKIKERSIPGAEYQGEVPKMLKDSSDELARL